MTDQTRKGAKDYEDEMAELRRRGDVEGQFALAAKQRDTTGVAGSNCPNEAQTSVPAPENSKGASVTAQDRTAATRLERRRETNRQWHRKARDGQCEALTKRGTRCVFVGQYDGLTGEVRCGIHAE